jgi:hypothetical protein
MRLAVLFVAASLALFPGASKSSSSSSSRASSAKTTSSRPKAVKAPKAAKVPKATARRPSNYCTSCERDSRGRIRRSESATSTFRRLNPCPATGRTTGRCPGYVIDHITPLKRGGPDAPYNMQWQTKAEAKAKDRTE